MSLLTEEQKRSPINDLVGSTYESNRITHQLRRVEGEARAMCCSAADEIERLHKINSRALDLINSIANAGAFPWWELGSRPPKRELVRILLRIGDVLATAGGLISAKEFEERHNQPKYGTPEYKAMAEKAAAHYKELEAVRRSIAKADYDRKWGKKSTT